MLLENNYNITIHFPEFEGFRIAKQTNNRIIYEKYYDNLKNFIPRKNETTNEIERCTIIIEAHELKNNLRKLAIRVKRCFPSGTDYDNNKIVNYNIKLNLIPLDFDYFDKFFLNEKNGELFKKNHKIKIDTLLNKLYQFHIRPSKRILGIIIRTKLKLSHYVFNIIQLSIKGLEFVMRFACGKYMMKENTAQEAYLETLNRNQIKIVESKSIELPTGWECSKNVAFVSSLLIFLLFYLFWNSIKASPVIAIILIPAWIIILYSLDIILPTILLLFINGLIKIIRIK